MAEASTAKSSTDVAAAIITAAIIAKGTDATIQNAVVKFWEVRAGLTARHRAPRTGG